MIVRIVNGLPVEEDIVLALENFADTKYVKSRQELFLHECPMCHATDNRGNGTQGAISYSLRLHCTTCAKCGESVGWVETLRALGVEYVHADTGPSPYEALSRAAREMAEKSSSEQPEFINHGDWKMPVDQALGEHLVRFLAPGGKVKPWLEARGFTFGDDYGMDPSKAWAGECAAGWCVIVYRNRDGSARGFKYRNITEKNFDAQKGAQSEPYGIHRIDPENASLTITEGEFDCEILNQMGFKNVISLPNGASSWKPDWCEYLNHAMTVFVATDEDKEGRIAASKIFSDVPKLVPTVSRIARVIFCDKSGDQVKDANEAFIGGSRFEEFKECFLRAEDPDVIAIESAKRNAKGYFIETHWQSLNQVLGGGLLIGEVIHLAGGPKSGKTSIILDLHRDMAKRNIKTGIVPLDMNTGKISIRAGMALLGETDSSFYKTDVGGLERSSALARMDAAMSMHYKGRFLISKDQRTDSYSQSLGIVERMCRSGCRLVTVEDYLSLAFMYERESKGRSMFGGRKIITDLADIAERCGSHIILINHLKSDEGSSSAAYGAGQIGASAQANIHLSTKKDATGSTIASVMHVKESRFSKTSDVDIEFSFDSTSRVLTSSPHTRHVYTNAKKSGGKGSGGRRGEGWNF